MRVKGSHKAPRPTEKRTPVPMGHEIYADMARGPTQLTVWQRERIFERFRRDLSQAEVVSSWAGKVT